MSKYIFWKKKSKCRLLKFLPRVLNVNCLDHRRYRLSDIYVYMSCGKRQAKNIRLRRIFGKQSVAWMLYCSFSIFDEIKYYTHWNQNQINVQPPDCRSRWLSWMRRPTGDQEVPGSTPAEVGNILSWRLIMKYFLRPFSPLIQEGQLSVSGERMCTILVNRLED